MPIQQSDVLYTAVATAENGRDGRVATDDGTLDVVVNPPKEMGGSGAGTNPEQLFAAGYSACFQGALGVVARQEGADLSGSTFPKLSTSFEQGRPLSRRSASARTGTASGSSSRSRPTSPRSTGAPRGRSSRRPTRCARTRRRPAATSP